MAYTDNPKITVIIPAYNAEQTIEQCVMSLIDQTIPVKIIVINDGSSDKTLDICNKLSREYLNVSVIDKENGGVASARNTGLDAVDTDYVGFVDSDDSAHSDMFEKLLEPYEKNLSIDITICYAEHCQSEQKILQKSHSDIVKDIVCSNYVRGYPWNKLFKMKTISDDHIRFREDIHVMEDKLFCLEYMASVEGDGVELTEELYQYDSHVDAKGEQRYQIQKYKTGLIACEEILKLDCINRNPEVKAIQQCIMVKHCVQIARHAYRNGYDVTEYKIKSKPYRALYFKSSYITLKQKLGYFVLQYFPWLLKYC